jgi:hypothetical protein
MAARFNNLQRIRKQAFLTHARKRPGSSRIAEEPLTTEEQFEVTGHSNVPVPRKERRSTVRGRPKSGPVTQIGNPVGSSGLLGVHPKPINVTVH